MSERGFGLRRGRVPATGASAACPSDVVAPATTQCRASTDGNICDPPEYCTGKSNQCPADAKYSPPAAAPGGVLVTPGDLLADVAWNAVTGATGYNVKSSTISGAGYSVRGSPTSSPFTVTPITASLTYYFVVSAYSGQPSCESADSSPPVSALSCVATAPTALAATPDAAGHVALTWTPPSGSVASYSVSRSTTSGSGYAVLASGILTTSYTDTPVVPAGGTTTFYYVVRAYTGTCLSPYSTPAAAVIPSPGADAGADAAADAATTSPRHAVRSPTLQRLPRTLATTLPQTDQPKTSTHCPVMAAGASAAKNNATRATSAGVMSGLAPG